MTVTTQSTKAVYSGDGSTTSWPFSFPLQAASDMVVTVTDAFGTATVLAPSAYTIPGQFPLWGGGNVVTNATVAAGSKISLQRVMGFTQPTSLTAQSSFNPSIIEQAMDRIVLLAQQLGNTQAFTRSNDDTAALPVPSPTSRANGVLGFDANGQPTIVAGQGSVAPSGVIGTNTTLTMFSFWQAPTASSPVSAHLPAASSVPEGAWCVVYDADCTAGTHNITITAGGSDTIKDHNSSGSSFVGAVDDIVILIFKRNGQWRAITFGF